MEQLTEKAHQIVVSRLKPGDIAIDATAGNGHDTVFLAQAVGPMGWVYAFDVQPEAISQTLWRLEQAGLTNVSLLLRDHAEMARWIPAEHHGKIAAVMFNLGYLPGSDKTYRTQADSTRKAVTAALELLREGGVLTVVAYTGHPGGLEEAAAVEELLQTLSEKLFTVEVFSPTQPQAPRLLIATRREGPS